jgi:hypothetical protein
MKEPFAPRKVAAVVSSSVLIAGFVCYHSGAFSRRMAPGPQPADPSSSPAAGGPSFSNFEPRTTDPTPTMMSSTKSFTMGTFNFTVSLRLRDELSGSTQLAAPPATEKPLTMMSGSKSTTLNFSGKFSGSFQPPPPSGTQKTPTIMPSSKVGSIFPAD